MFNRTFEFNGNSISCSFYLKKYLPRYVVHLFRIDCNNNCKRERTPSDCCFQQGFLKVNIVKNHTETELYETNA